MADFFQTNSVATLHRLRSGRLSAMEAELTGFSRHTGMSLILPALITEFERPAMRRIVEELRHARYYNNIVVAIGRATRKQVEEAARWFDGFRSPVTILWMEDPRVPRSHRWKRPHLLALHGLPAGRRSLGRDRPSRLRHRQLHPGNSRRALLSARPPENGV